MTLSAVKNILDNVDIITSEVYCKILNVLRPGLATKLRLVPDNALASKLAHLLAVCKIEENSEVLSFPYESISVEGSDLMKYPFDHDAIVKNKLTDKIVVIDCTASAEQMTKKKELLLERVKGHEGIDFPYVHVFKAKKFVIEVKQPENLYCASSPIFNLFDKICDSSKLYRNKFFQACEDIYDIVSKDELGVEREELNERYEPWNTEELIVTQSVNLARCHDIYDALHFENISSIPAVKIYFDTFKKILSQQRPLSQPFQVMPAELNKVNKLESVLLELEGSVIVKGLLYAIKSPKEWIGVTAKGKVVQMGSRPKSKTALLEEDSEFSICVKNMSEHVFQIYFSQYIVDDNFLEQILKKPKGVKRKDLYDLNVQKAYDQILDDYSKYYDEFSGDSTNIIKNSILGKISSLGSIYSDEETKPSAAVCGSVAGVVDRIRQMKLGDLIDHSYEIAKTFAAALKVSPRENFYYVGVNGAYTSITIIKMTGTQDSFNVASYFTIYKALSTDRLFSVKNHYIINENYCQSKTRTFNRNTLAHALKLPFSFISLLTWEIENNTSEHATMSGHDFMRLVVNSALHVSINSDQFSQCAEQLRYLFTSNIGYGASASAICEKIDFIRTNTTWELLYLFRMLKMACALNIVFKNKRIRELIDEGKWIVAFPNSVNTICSFSHLVSSMYYCNVYNKFRAFHEISEAICYNELESENLIYLNCISKNINFVHGISSESFILLMSSGSLDVKKFISNEVEFCRNLVKDGPGRFKMSISFIIGATRRHVKVDPDVIQLMYKALAESPIEACTMKGAMESGSARKEHQGIRSASSLIEELIEEKGFVVEDVNQSAFTSNLLLEELQHNPFDYSIFSAVARQFMNKDEYRYRIVQKDQKGHREISVLNAKFRLGALFCEKSAQVLSKLVHSDVLDDPSKDVLMERKVRECISGSENEVVISDNSDQKRWGPNHLLHSFSAMFLALLSEDLGLFRIINLVLHKAENKLAKFPENIMDLIKKDRMKSKSEPLQEFFKNNFDSYTKEIVEKKFEWGMCQGIFHRTSSLFHGIMCSVVSDVCKKVEGFPRHSMYSYVTSDDAERIITIHDKVDDKVVLCKKVHSIINNVGCVMNILRNESKSVFSFHITEFNSIFYHNGYLATPTLKQRISKIDIGEGADPILDYLTALSLSMGYFQTGGSYFGTCTLMLLNIALHTEQWNRWHIISKGVDVFKRPVEFGGFPYIEPLSVMYCGPISSLFLRSIKYADKSIFSYAIMESTMIEAAEVNLDEFQRNEMAPVDSKLSDLKVFKSAGPIGVFSFSRTDRRLSRFEKRHRLSNWDIKEDGITLDKTSSDASKFLFNLQRITKTCQFEKHSGTNSFYIRFSDPWVNSERACLRLHPNSLIVKEVISKRFSVDQRVCPSELNAFLLSVNISDIKRYYRDRRNRPRDAIGKTVLEHRLSMLMGDAEKIYNTLAVPYELKYISADTKNCIARINLSIQNNVDDDIYYYRLLKSVVGDKIKNALIEKTYDQNVWDKIQIIENLPQKDVIDGIFFCSNVLQLAEKYIRSATKVICPSNTVPNNISEFMYQVLSSRYTEKYGVKVKKFPKLDTTHVVIRAFNTCNHTLVERSLQFWYDKEEMIDFTKSREPPPFGIVIPSDNIEPNDEFMINDNVRIKKTVHLHAKGKSNFITKLKMWTGAYVDVRLSEGTKQSLLRNEFTNFHEYCVNSQTYVKNQTGLLYDIIIGGKHCFEMQKFDLVNKQYIHYYLYESGTHLANAEAFYKHKGEEKPWVKRIVKFINKTKNFTANIDYEIPTRSSNKPDIVKFIPISSVDKFEIRTFPNNLTIFLEHNLSKVLIPICSQQLTELKDINLNLNYSIDNLKEALIAFKVVGEKLVGYEEMDEFTRDFIALILFKTSVFTGLDEINDWIKKKNSNISITSIESADILRSLILSCTAKKMVGNRVRIHHYFLNLFRNSPNYNNGITRIKTEFLDISADGLEEELQAEMGGEILDFTSRIERVQETVEPKMQFVRNIKDVYKPGDERDNNFRELEFNIDPDIDELGEGLFETDIIKSKDDSSSDDDYTDSEEDDYFRSLAHDDVEDVTVTSSYVMNRPFEVCRGMIDEIKEESDRLKPKRAPRRYYAHFKTLFDVFKALTSIEFNDERTVEVCLSEMYKGEDMFFSTRYPFSAHCLTELYFN